MDSSFWHERWHANQIAFHEIEGNALFTAHFAELALPVDSRVFIPLCGKTRDIQWLLAKGYRVAGAELSELAIHQLFEELEFEPQTETVGELTRYHGRGIDIFVGDIFALDGEILGTVNAIYDRAALVALPDSMRERYAKHLIQITNGAPQLLITFEYDQSQMDGPPFSVSAQHIDQYYSTRYSVRSLDRAPVKDGLKGKVTSTENVWLLTAQ